MSNETQQKTDQNSALNKNQEARSYIEHFMLTHGSTLVISDIPEIIDLRANIMATGIKSADATHLASAIHSHCDYFITTDDRYSNTGRMRSE